MRNIPRGVLGGTLLLLLVTACGAPNVGEAGNAFASSEYGISSFGVSKAIPVGEEWVALAASMRNESDIPVTLLSADVTGKGLGTVVEVVSIEIAPRESRGGSVPGGMYSVYPPAWQEDGRCAVVDPHPVKGYVVPPSGYPYLMVRLRAIAPGHFKIASHLVSYEYGLFEYEEEFPIQVQGGVSRNGKEQFTPYPEELECVPREGLVLH